MHCSSQRGPARRERRHRRSSGRIVVRAAHSTIAAAKHEWSGLWRGRSAPAGNPMPQPLSQCQRPHGRHSESTSEVEEANRDARRRLHAAARTSGYLADRLQIGGDVLEAGAEMDVQAAGFQADSAWPASRRKLPPPRPTAMLWPNCPDQPTDVTRRTPNGLPPASLSARDSGDATYLSSRLSMLMRPHAALDCKAQPLRPILPGRCR